MCAWLYKVKSLSWETYVEVEPVLDANGDDSHRLSKNTDRYVFRFPTETTSHLVLVFSCILAPPVVPEGFMRRTSDLSCESRFVWAIVPHSTVWSC